MSKLTVTGRTPSEPDIQNLPGTYAYWLEMFYARHGVRHHATFDEWETSGQSCPRCGREHVEVRVHESSDGSHEDYQYRCNDCGHTWWVDGIDS